MILSHEAHRIGRFIGCIEDRGWERWIYGLRLWMKVRRDGTLLKMGSLYTTW